MNRMFWFNGAGSIVLGALLVAACVASVSAQTTPQQAPPANPPNSNTSPQNNPAGKATDTPDLKVNPPAPVNTEEDTAYKTFDAIPATDANKRIDAGEAFATKYPQSRYLPLVYSNLTMLYLNSGQVDKMQATGEKEIALKPDDVQVMAVLGQTIPRAMTSSTPHPDEQLAKAEGYSKKAIELTPTIAKPPALTDDQFATAKNETLAMAHSGLGLVYVRRQKYAEAIPELSESVKIDPKPDPVNYYLLGLSDEKTSHFDDAVEAFKKCAALPSSMAATCKTQAEEAKKLGATQLSAPK